MTSVPLCLSSSSPTRLRLSLTEAPLSPHTRKYVAPIYPKWHEALTLLFQILDQVSIMSTQRPSVRPLTSVARSLSTAPTGSAPGSFYGGMIGGSYIEESERTYKNATGRPSHGREDALFGVAAAQEFVKDPTKIGRAHV